MSPRRQAGMAPNPLTYTELEAFERKALVRFSAWEADLLMRVDDTVLGAWAAQMPRPKAKARAADGGIPVENTKVIAALFRGFMGRKKGAGQPTG